MTWGTDFKTDIFLSRQTFQSKLSVQDEINELIEKMSDCLSQIKMYVASTPINIIPKEFTESPINWLNNEINILFDSYNEDLINKYKLELYCEYLDYTKEMNTGVNKDIKDLLFDMNFTLSGKQSQYTGGLLSVEEYKEECDNVVYEVIDRIKTKLLTHE